MRKTFVDLENKVKQIVSRQGGGADSKLFESLRDDLEKLRQDFDHYRSDSDERIVKLEREMPFKADRSELIELENRLIEKFKEMLQ